MTDERLRALEALLSEAGEAHGVYEAAELRGVYDEAWPRWYAAYAIEHGLGRLLGREIGVEELASLLASSWDDVRASGGSAETWPANTARRIIAGR
jgi:hypothetical protein